MKKTSANEVWFLYVLECSDCSLYTGISNNIEKRLKEHNTGLRGAKYTRSRRPVTFLISWKFKTKSGALKAEFRFKQLSKHEKQVAILYGHLPDQIACFQDEY